MKGGITSGVVYPHAICELAQVYRFRNVGGTSAGAIAAAATAAAEYGRASGGFQRLAGLPAWIGAGQNLRSLFQAQNRTRPLFNVLLTAITRRRGRPLRLVGSLIANFFVAALIGGALGAALIVVAAVEASGWLLAVALVGGTVLAVLGCALGITCALARRLTRDVADNAFGMCSGYSPEGQEPRALTPWLADSIDALAGASEPIGNDLPPLTFGDLWSGPPGDHGPDGRYLNLEMMTTNVINRRPQRLPWGMDDFFYDPAQLRQFFPERVVCAMVDHPPPEPSQPAERREWRLLCALLEPLKPMPSAEDLPVVVATRLSLSFPLLLSAIPLWAVDRSREANQGAEDAWRAWARSTDDWESQLGDPETRAALEQEHGRLIPEVCWFSDGGISSNFPIHFFDTPLPRWPTFGINLRPFHPDHGRNDQDESQNVWMANTNAGGRLEWWYRFPPRAGRFSLLDKRVVAFGSAVVRTMQNRVDEAQMRMPGYRDRVVHISHTDAEGGINLTMEPTDITRLAERGHYAGVRLAERFACPPPQSPVLGWANHRWVRYRASTAAIEGLLGAFGRGYSLPTEHPDDTTYVDLISRGPTDPPASYRWKRVAQQEFAHLVTQELADIDALVQEAGETFAEGAPRPISEVQIGPP